MQRHETFSFGDDFKLEVRHDSSGRRMLTLFKGEGTVADTLKPTLDLLHLLLRHPKQVLSDDTILDALWRNSAPAIVDKHISFLRDALDDDPRNPTYIQTIHSRGYKFLVSVKREGGGIDAYPTWDTARLHELLRDLKRGPESDSEDVRIAATGLGSSVDEFGIKTLLQKHLRLKVLLMNPNNTSLVAARYSSRQDKPMERCVRELSQQIEDLDRYALRYPVASNMVSQAGIEIGAQKGELDFGLSDVMPCGIVIHTREWALVGVILAHDSFTSGPIYRFSSGLKTD